MKSFMLSVLLLSAMASPLYSSDCIDYGDYLHFVSRFFGGDVRGVAVQGDLVYVARQTQYVGGTDFLCVDLSDPFDPVLVGEIDTGAHGFDVQVQGNHAYLVSPGVGVHVIDISNPATPVAVGFLPSPDAWTVWIDGAVCYVAARASGLISVDVTDPTNPVPLDTITVGTNVWMVETQGGYAFAAAAEGGLAVVDISNPAAMTIETTLDLSIFARSLDVSGAYAHVGGNSVSEGLVVVDVSTPTAPSITGGATGAAGLSVVIDGDITYMGSSHVNIFDVSTPSLPQLVMDSDVGVWANKGHAIALGNGFLVTAAGEEGMEVGIPGIVAAPPRLGVYTGATAVFNCRAAGTKVVAGTFNPTGVQVVDASNPALPSLVGTATMPVASAAATDMDIDATGNYAVVPYFRSFDPDGFVIFDVSASPSVVATCTTPYRPERCTWVGDYLYVTDNWNSPGRLVIYDMTNPASPLWVGAVPIGAYTDVVGVDVVGNYAYVAIDDPTLPDAGPLAIIDVSNKAAPVVTAITTSDLAGHDVLVNGNYAYVIEDAVNGARMAIIDVSNPAAPTIVEVQWLVERGQGLAKNGTHLYVANFDRGVQVFDLSDPASPGIVGNLHSDDRSWDLACDGDRVYVASEAAGLEIYDAQCVVATGISSAVRVPSSARLVAAWPNPFNPQTTIGYELSRRQHVRVTVHDASGRVVAVLEDGFRGAGRGEIVWDGRAQTGLAAASGVYFVRLKAAESTDTIKIVLLK
jgi:hypothetical protein